jgi:hypothetical protein
LQDKILISPVETADKGVGGETVGARLARLERDVPALRPDLVV